MENGVAGAASGIYTQNRGHPAGGRWELGFLTSYSCFLLESELGASGSRRGKKGGGGDVRTSVLYLARIGNLFGRAVVVVVFGFCFAVCACAFESPPPSPLPLPLAACKCKAQKRNSTPNTQQHPTTPSIQR
jgi:hypothetical protein